MHAERHVVAQVAGSPKQAIRARIDRLLADPRLERIRADDLRYGWNALGKAESLPQLLRHWKSTGRVPKAGARLVAGLELGAQSTLAEDIRNLAERFSQTAFQYGGVRSRAVEIFVARYGASTIGAKISELAEAFDCTHQRITQIIKKMTAVGAEDSVVSLPALALVARAQELSKVVPTDEQLAAALGLGPGAGHSMPVFRRFCVEILRLSEGDVAAIGQLRTGQTGPQSRPRIADASAAFMRRAKEHCRASAAVHLATLVGELALDDGITVSKEVVQRVIDSDPGSRWLDREAGWFTLDVLKGSYLEGRVREILAVAQRAVPIRDIAGALLSDVRHNYQKQDEFSPVPLGVLRGALLGLSGIVSDGWGQLSDQSGARPEDVLSPTHLQIYQALAKRGGVARKSDVIAEVQPGSVKATIHVHISLTSFVYTIGPSLYALLGWPLSEDDILKALSGACEGDVVMVVKRPAAAGGCLGAMTELRRSNDRQDAE